MNQDIYSRLLTALSSPQPGKNAQDIFQEVLSELGDRDPKMKLITTYLARQQADREDIEEKSTVDAPLKKKKRSFTRLRNMINHLHRELEELRERNDTLAAALGACYLCWGENPECPECSGNGRPGFFRPDIPLFNEYVIPATRRSQGIVWQENNGPLPGSNTDKQKLDTNKGEKNE